MNGKDQVKHINLQYYIEKLIDERCESIAKGFELVEKEFELVDEKFKSRDDALKLSKIEIDHGVQRKVTMLGIWVTVIGVVVVLIDTLLHVMGH